MWKTIEDFPDYQVSERGEIRNAKTLRVLKQKVLPSGYLFVQLYRDKKPHTVYVHRMVAKAFIINPYNKPEVNHIDGDKGNPAASNLEWVTKSENMMHSARVLGNLPSPEHMAALQCAGTEASRKRVLCVETGLVFKSALAAERILGVDHSHIAKSCRGKLRTAGGYHWQYAEVIV